MGPDPDVVHPLQAWREQKGLSLDAVADQVTKLAQEAGSKVTASARHLRQIETRTRNPSPTLSEFLQTVSRGALDARQLVFFNRQHPRAHVRRRRTKRVAA